MIAVLIARCMSVLVLNVLNPYNESKALLDDLSMKPKTTVLLSDGARAGALQRLKSMVVQLARDKTWVTPRTSEVLDACHLQTISVGEGHTLYDFSLKYIPR